MPFLILLSLAYRLNGRTGQCDPSIATLADDCKMSKRACQNGLDWLVENGFIRRLKTGSRSRGRSNQYQIVGYREPSGRVHEVPYSTGCHIARDATEVWHGVPYSTTRHMARDATEPWHEVPYPIARGANEQGIEQGKEHLSHCGGDGATDPARKPDPTAGSDWQGQLVVLPGGGGWQASELDREYAKSEGFSDPLIDQEAEKFRAYHLASGKRNVDWHAAWRHWILNSYKHPKMNGNQHLSKGSDNGRNHQYSGPSDRPKSQGERQAALLAGAARALDRR